jgi:hypothetical protein
MSPVRKGEGILHGSHKRTIERNLDIPRSDNASPMRAGSPKGHNEKSQFYIADDEDFTLKNSPLRLTLSPRDRILDP